MTDTERAELNRLRQLETDEQPSDLNDISTVACLAWTAVKRVDDAAWNDLPMDMKHKLEALAEKAVAGRTETEGDYAPVGYFEAVRSVASEKPEGVDGDTSTHAPNGDAVQVDPNGPPVVHGDGSPPPDVLDGDVRPPGSGFQEPPTEFPPLHIDETGLGIEELRNANETRAEVSDEALANQEPEFPSLHPESAAHLSNETFVPAAQGAEPEPPGFTVGPKGPLPADFPGLLPLKDAGINTFSQLRKRLDSGEHVPGVGPALLAKIEDRLSK